MGPFDDSMTFIYTNNLDRSVKFYRHTLELPMVLEQANCKVFQVSESGYLGVCARSEAPKPDGVIVTFVTEDVDRWYEKLSNKGIEFEKIPAFNEKYNIYHCFFRDPDGYLLEIQRFSDSNWAKPVN
ncbi:MAG: VOC family protein [Proteobacteria bacterium]|nr:VOC family protein [Pseudomonadota bacterium]